MNRKFQPSDFQIKQGTFVILSTGSGDRYADVTSEAARGLMTEERTRQVAAALNDRCGSLRGTEHWLHPGCIIVDALDSNSCAEVLNVTSQDEAEAELARFRAALCA